MKKHRHKLAVTLVGIGIFIAVATTIYQRNSLSGAIQLSESDQAVPEACFKVKSYAGMTNANESVLFGSKDRGELGATFTFDARCSKDKDNSASEIHFNWDFGDGAKEYAYEEGNVETEHIYFETGTYKVKLYLADPDGNKAQYEQTVKVVQNTGPHITLKISPEKGTTSQEFTFDITGTYHDQFKENYLEYRWDFNGDKVVEKDWGKQKKIKYKYPYGTEGIQKIYLEVRDPSGYTKTQQQEVEIIANTAPEMNLFIVPDTVGTFDTTFYVDLSSSLDKESTYKCRIDSDYNGKDDIIFDRDFSTSCFWSKRWLTETGKHNIHVEIEDKDGARVSQIATMEVHDSSEYFKYLKSKRVIQGYSYKVYKIQTKYGKIKLVKQNELTKEDKTLRIFNISNDMQPMKTATRAEITKMALTAFGISTSGVNQKDLTFADVNTKDWYYKYMIKAYKEGIISGYKDCFTGICKLYAKPNDLVTRAEALKIIFSAAKFQLLQNGEQKFNDVPNSHWAFKQVNTAYVFDLIDPVSTYTFGINDKIKRHEIAEILYKIMVED